MDLDHSGTTLAERPSDTPRLPGTHTRRAEQDIQQRLANAEHLIRKQRPAQALALLHAPGVPPATWRLRRHPRWYLLVGWALIQDNQPQEARVVLEQGLATLTRLLSRSSQAGRTVPGEWQAWLYYFLGISFGSDDQPVQALLCHQEGLKAIAGSTGHDAELAMLLYQGLGDAYVTLGAYPQAIACLTRAKQRGEDVCAPRARGLIEWSLGLAYQFQGDLSRARGAFSRAVSLFEQLDAKLQVSQLRSLVGQVLMWMQRYDEAEAMLRQALGAAERTGDPFTRAMTLRNLAALQLGRGKPEKAIRTIRDGLALLEERKGGQIVGLLYLTLARAYTAQQNPSAAEAALTAATTALKQTHQHGLLVHALERYSNFLADQGRFQEAYEQLLLASHHTASALTKNAGFLAAGRIGRELCEDGSARAIGAPRSSTRAGLRPGKSGQKG
jgi:tetratricopeptide (TPR) repeat protein